MIMFNAEKKKTLHAKNATGEILMEIDFKIYIYFYCGFKKGLYIFIKTSTDFKKKILIS